MGFAAIAGRRISHQLSASINSSSSVTNNTKKKLLSSTTKQNRAAIRGWTFNECRHSSKHFPLYATGSILVRGGFNYVSLFIDQFVEPDLLLTAYLSDIRHLQSFDMAVE